jgi:S-adenosylmethionine-diacylglycerol 3-amino-3-carboxypropyl transferase
VLPNWVREAAGLPLAFAQVREDALQDLSLVESLREGAAVLLVASGGCTAAALAANPRVARIRLVDPNSAQLALCRLKLRLLEGTPSQDRLAFLGHAPLEAAAREAALAPLWSELGLEPNALGPWAETCSAGPDAMGRYERTFAALRAQLAADVDPLNALLRLSNPDEQAARIAGTSLGAAIDEAWRVVFDLPILVALFGEGATANRAVDFSAHFAARTRHVLSTLPAATNPYLWQVFAGAYPPGHPVTWLELPCPTRLADVTFEQASMNEALADDSERFDLIHLSNILDWLTPDAAEETLARTWERLAPGGVVIVRQLNSTLDVRAAGSRFAWDLDTAARLHAGDRSFFYRELHVGRRVAVR